MDELTQEPVVRLFEIHALGTFLVTKAAWPHLIASGAGRVVNTISESMLGQVPKSISYATAKGAVFGFTRGVALDGMRHGIRVNALAPRGLTRKPYTILRITITHVPPSGKPPRRSSLGPTRHAGEPVIIPLHHREKRAVSVARAILHDIRQDGLSAGDRLPPEITMLERYQVARGTLREALRILEVQSLIRIRPGREGGPVVNDPTPRDFSHVLTLFLQGMDVTMQDLLDARRSVEPLMARLAAESYDAARYDDLAKILAQTEDAVGWDEVATAVGAFHRRILTMSGNPVLDLWAATLQQTIDYREGPAWPEEAIEAIRSEHLAIGRAILDRDGERAAQLMAEHMGQIHHRTSLDADFLRQRIEWR